MYTRYLYHDDPHVSCSQASHDVALTLRLSSDEEPKTSWHESRYFSTKKLAATTARADQRELEATSTPC